MPPLGRCIRNPGQAQDKPRAGGSRPWSEGCEGDTGPRGAQTGVLGTGGTTLGQSSQTQNSSSGGRGDGGAMPCTSQRDREVRGQGQPVGGGRLGTHTAWNRWCPVGWAGGPEPGPPPALPPCEPLNRVSGCRVGAVSWVLDSGPAPEAWALEGRSSDDRLASSAPSARSPRRSPLGA